MLTVQTPKIKIYTHRHRNHNVKLPPFHQNNGCYNTDDDRYQLNFILLNRNSN